MSKLGEKAGRMIRRKHELNVKHCRSAAQQVREDARIAREQGYPDIADSLDLMAGSLDMEAAESERWIA